MNQYKLNIDIPNAIKIRNRKSSTNKFIESWAKWLNLFIGIINRLKN